MKKENTSIRLKKIMSDRNIRQIDILNLTIPYCQKYGVKMNKSDISQYCSGKTEPNQDKLFVLGMALNVSEAWLMGYDVPMERNTFKEPPQGSIASFKNIEEFKRVFNKSKFRGDRLTAAILENTEKLNNTGKKSLLDYSYFLLDKSENTLVSAAHERTDINVTDEMIKHDDDIMDDENF